MDHFRLCIDYDLKDRGDRSLRTFMRQGPILAAFPRQIERLCHVLLLGSLTQLGIVLGTGIWGTEALAQEEVGSCLSLLRQRSEALAKNTKSAASAIEKQELESAKLLLQLGTGASSFEEGRGGEVALKDLDNQGLDLESLRPVFQIINSTPLLCNKDKLPLRKQGEFLQYVLALHKGTDQERQQAYVQYWQKRADWAPLARDGQEKLLNWSILLRLQKEKKDHQAFVNSLNLAKERGKMAEDCQSTHASGTDKSLYHLITGLTGVPLPSGQSTTHLTEEQVEQIVQFVESHRHAWQSGEDFLISHEKTGLPVDIHWRGNGRLFLHFPAKTAGGLVGSGSYKKVYKSIDYDSGELLARLEVQLTGKDGKETIKRKLNMKRELELLQAVQGLPHLIQTIDFFDIKEQGVDKSIIMQPYYPLDMMAAVFEEGHEDGLFLLGKGSEKIRFSKLELLDLAIDIVRGFKKLHKHARILHKDVKFENIMLGYDFEQKRLQLAITDFGLSAFAKDEDQRLKLSGTPGYVSPRFIVSKYYKDKDDIWTVGQLLYLLFHKIPPFWMGREWIADLENRNFARYKMLYTNPGQIKTLFEGEIGEDKDEKRRSFIEKYNRIVQGLLSPNGKGQTSLKDAQKKLLKLRKEVLQGLH